MRRAAALMLLLSAAASPATATPRDAATRAPPTIDQLLSEALGEHAAKPRARPLVVIDAGHGGHDYGAPSVLPGRHEKDATLAIARALADTLNAGGRVRAQLTRDGDLFLALPERVRIARAAGAALFLSIHCDSAPNPEAHGATVYTLSDTASDALAARAAARENRAGLVRGLELNDSDPETAGLLFAMTSRGTMNASAEFAAALRRAFDPAALRADAHRTAGFAVLKTGDVPAALIETGYVTNEGDAAMLFSDEGRAGLARSIASAVEGWFDARNARAARTAAAPQPGAGGLGTGAGGR